MGAGRGLARARLRASLQEQDTACGSSASRPSARVIAFVRATLEDGSIGWGQLSTYNSDITADVFHRQAAPWVLGEEAWPIDPLIDRIEEKEQKFPGADPKRAMAGLDTALWDLESKRQEKPVVTLLGGKSASCAPMPHRCAATSRRRPKPARFVQLRDRHGFDAFKLKSRGGIRP